MRYLVGIIGNIDGFLFNIIIKDKIFGLKGIRDFEVKNF